MFWLAYLKDVAFKWLFQGKENAGVCRIARDVVDCLLDVLPYFKCLGKHLSGLLGWAKDYQSVVAAVAAARLRLKFNLIRFFVHLHHFLCQLTCGKLWRGLCWVCVFVGWDVISFMVLLGKHSLVVVVVATNILFVCNNLCCWILVTISKVDMKKKNCWTISLELKPNQTKKNIHIYEVL